MPGHNRRNRQPDLRGILEISAGLGARENKMNAAITYLETSLNVLETNEPINRSEGNIEQADLEAISISQIKEGIEVLKSFGIV